jgi:flagellar hook-length control protein FliK
MHAEQAGARDLIQQQLPVLHQALEARDLRVDRLQVSHAEQGGAAQQSFDSRGFADQQRQQREEAPEWSPLASFGASARASKSGPARPRVAMATAGRGGIDVMA